MIFSLIAAFFKPVLNPGWEPISNWVCRSNKDPFAICSHLCAFVPLCQLSVIISFPSLLCAFVPLCLCAFAPLRLSTLNPKWISRCKICSRNISYIDDKQPCANQLNYYNVA